MPSQDTILEQQRLLEAYRGTLAHYLYQRALLDDAHVTPEITHGIREARNNIQRIKKILRAWSVDIEDLPDDGDLESTPSITENAKKTAELGPQRLQQLPLTLLPEPIPVIDDYNGYWIYEIINIHWTIEVYAAMHWKSDSTTHSIMAKGKVWKKGRAPNPKDLFGEWDSEPFPLHPEITNLFFNFICYEEYERDEKLRVPKRTNGVLRIKLYRDLLEGYFKDFLPEREGYGSFRAVRVSKPAGSLEQAGKEAFEVFGAPSQRYAEWLAAQHLLHPKRKKSGA